MSDPEYEERIAGYTLDELRDAEAHISRDASPERHRLLLAEIERRRHAPTAGGPGGTSPGPTQRSGMLLAAAFYAFIATGAIPLYYYVRATGEWSEEEWAGTTPFDQYFGPGLIYYGSAALCAYWLVRRRAMAVWPARVIALWVGLQQVGGLWRWLHGRESFPLLLIGGFGVLALVIALLFYVQRLRREGVLQSAKP
ncbi:MAG: hypothetical protein ACYTG2_10520 [Planctomycetota bacterium]|jgi:hypothetical protein